MLWYVPESKSNVQSRLQLKNPMQTPCKNCKRGSAMTVPLILGGVFLLLGLVAAILPPKLAIVPIGMMIALFLLIEFIFLWIKHRRRDKQ